MEQPVETSCLSLAALRQQLQAHLRDIPLFLEDSEIAPYCRDWHGDCQSNAVAVLRPGTTLEVSHCVKTCAALGLAIVPQGGNTGLVYGAMPDDERSQVVISLERMNKVRRIDTDDFSVVVDAGCILESLKEKVAEHGLLFPLALGAQGSCQIGGNISTNAGGVNVLHYGMTRDLVLGLEVVLPDGTVLDLLRTLRKDNRGIDLKQLFIGAEGTLGIITGAALKLWPQPEQVETALLGLNSLQDVLALYRLARRACSDLMTAFEFMQPLSLRLAMEAYPDLIMPIGECPAYVLMEVSGSGLIDIRDLLERFLEQAMDIGLVQDGVVAMSRAQSTAMWRFREGVNEGQARRGKHLRSDVSVPLSRLADFVQDAQRELMQAFPDADVLAYGHVGDGNVHMNVLPSATAPAAQRQRILHEGKEIINRWVDHYEGSISAEHGIGRLKRQDFEQRLPAIRRRLLIGLRALVDAENRMNPRCQIHADALGNTTSVM